MKQYDDVPYDTEANSDTHPASIATLAALTRPAATPRSARIPALPSTARVLEIGCGNGENLLTAATYLPGATFVGFDLASTAIDAGRAAARASGIENVELFTADIRDVRREPKIERGSFDFVIAHGMYSWIPDPVREDLLALMQHALAPHGVGFLSVNALPGWELRRTLRELVRDSALPPEDDPKARVEHALKMIGEVARPSTKPPRGFLAALKAAAREYLAHVERATPPEAPFARYVFHDLLAERCDPFSAGDLAAHLGAAGLRILCETPLRRGRLHDMAAPFDLALDMAREGTPFLQVLVERADANAPSPSSLLSPIHLASVVDLHLWADFTPAAERGQYRTTSGAVLAPVGEAGLVRALPFAPGFVRVSELVDASDAAAFSHQLASGMLDDVFLLSVEPPAIDARARVAKHVRVRASNACARGAPSAVLTSAIHRSFRVPWSSLAVIAELDGSSSEASVLTARARARAKEVSATLAGALAPAVSEAESERFVASVLDRFRRHLFFVDGVGA